MTEVKDNRGAIWANKDKKTDNHPDFRGNAMIDGTEYWVSAWRPTRTRRQTTTLISGVTR